MTFFRPGRTPKPQNPDLLQCVLIRIKTMYPFSPRAGGSSNASPSDIAREIFNFKGGRSGALGKAFSLRGVTMTREHSSHLSGFNSLRHQKRLAMREVHARKNRSPPEKATPFEHEEVQEEVQTIPSSMNFRIVEGTMLNPHDDDASDGLSFVPKRVESKAFSMQSSSSRRKSDPKRLFKNVQIVNAD